MRRNKQTVQIVEEHQPTVKIHFVSFTLWGKIRLKAWPCWKPKFSLTCPPSPSLLLLDELRSPSLQPHLQIPSQTHEQSQGLSHPGTKMKLLKFRMYVFLGNNY